MEIQHLNLRWHLDAPSFLPDFKTSCEISFWLAHCPTNKPREQLRIKMEATMLKTMADLYGPWFIGRNKDDHCFLA